jgi:hypothetical protein
MSPDLQILFSIFISFIISMPFVYAVYSNMHYAWKSSRPGVPSSPPVRSTMPVTSSGWTRPSIERREETGYTPQSIRNSPNIIRGRNGTMQAIIRDEVDWQSVVMQQATNEFFGSGQTHETVTVTTDSPVPLVTITEPVYYQNNISGIHPPMQEKYVRRMIKNEKTIPEKSTVKKKSRFINVKHGKDFDA